MNSTSNVRKTVGFCYRKDKRKRVAHEAANLLYTEQEKEYKQAKSRAAKTLGIHVLPSNFEIARELDEIARASEGKKRQEKLVIMRQQALLIMQTLDKFDPILVGSVWRGTAHHNSDIDITVFAQEPRVVISALEKSSRSITNEKFQITTEKGKKQHSVHIYIKLKLHDTAEIVVRNPEDLDHKVICEIYGDLVTGLTINELERVLKENPTQKFLPVGNSS
jgi:predicted nucleotidyltransferase